MSEIAIRTRTAMPVIARLKKFLYQRAIRRYRSTNLNKVPENHFSVIRSVGILFDASQAHDREVILAYAERLRGSGIKVSLCGFFNSKVEGITFPFDFIDLKSVSFAGLPRGEHVEKFIEAPFDVLINLDMSLHRPLNYIAAASKALFKIGPAEGDQRHYDLLIGIPDRNMEKFIHEIRTTFNKIQG
jgi:hypothetical protein